MVFSEWLLKYTGYNMPKLLGLDIGSKRIGVSVSDSSLKVALGLTVIHRTNRRSDISKIIEIIDGNDVMGIVVGLPLNLKGERGFIAQQVDQFVEHCKVKIPKRFVYWDERFTTLQIEKQMLSDGIKKNKARNRTLDEQAAQLILQGYLDFKSGHNVNEWLEEHVVNFSD